MLWSRSLVDADTADWVSEGFAWLIETFGQDAFDQTLLVLPTRAYFSSPGGDSHETAVSVFTEVKQHMGMADWPFRLVRQDAQPDTHIGTGMAVQGLDTSPGGTFGSDGEEFVITYDPGLLKTPVHFLNMASHELSHFLLAGQVNDAPGGEEAHEIFTDLTAIYNGFGVIQLEGGMLAAGFSGALEAGWRIGNLGYLSSEVRAFALALFVLAKGIDPELPRAHLSPDKDRLYKRGLKALKRDPARVQALAG